MTTQTDPRVRGFGPSRAQVLEHLRSTGAAEPVTAIARAVGLHENTTRFHLDALIDIGLVCREAESRRQPGRPRVLYRAEPAPSKERYRDLAVAMVRHFAGALDDRGLRAEKAGQAWGAEVVAALPAEPVEPLPRLLGCLARLGFQPQLVSREPPSIELRPCPYFDLAAEDPGTVCQLHLGLIRGLLTETDPWEVASLEPYATPELCIVRLAAKASGS
jgi:predicted ArsR family transcriptional regulator